MIKELILMYAPSVLCVIASAVGYYKSAKQLKKNAQTIIDSKQYKKLTKEMEQLRNQLACENQYFNRLIEQNKRIIEEYESNNKEVQEDTQNIYNT